MTRSRLFVFALLTSAAAWLAVAVANAEDAPAETKIDDADREHWAYQPLSDAQPPEVADPRWSSHPIDRFVRAALAEQAIEPLPAVGKATLLRRLSFDLTGLPPTEKEIAGFLTDDSPDAYERQVERLLASPAYGERWAQHWLDVARFAETDGFEHDLVRPNAWRYRDWVIDAIARDMPFDEFVSLQLAGDLLRPGDPQAAVATGFLLCGPDMPDINLQDERRHVVLNEMASTVGSVFLGLQVGCAQCHDHKFDPITQHDFYRLRAFFESADLFGDKPIPTPDELTARQAVEDAQPAEFREGKRRKRELEELARAKFRDKNPDVRPQLAQALAELSAEEQQEHAALVALLRKAPELPELSAGRVVREGAPRSGHLYIRGDFRREGPQLECGYPQVLISDASSCAPASDAAPRVALARWLTSGDQPLVARVIVNRLWQWHFGAGLQGTSSDFGSMGEGPTHPELLDWLARWFIDSGWSFKKFHRLIVTSEAYKAAAGPFDPAWSADLVATARVASDKATAADPQNALLWRRSRHRLDGEAVRDAMLTASGQLSTRRGGPGIRPPLPPEVTVTLLKDQWNVSGDDEDHRRRSIYLFVRRNLRYPMFDVFDRPDTMASCARRHESTTATQSLVLLNSEFSLDCARHLAGELIASQPDSPREQIAIAYLRVFNRAASHDELRLGEEFLARQRALVEREKRAAADLPLPAGLPDSADPRHAAGLVDLCLALFNASEFVYVD